MTILTINEVAEKLKLTKITVQRMCKAGTLPAFRIGKFWRIDEADFDKWYSSKSQGAEIVKAAEVSE